MNVKIGPYKEDGQDIRVHIDPWDTWSMDWTLALIILPMLNQLQKTEHCAPKVDNEDVPEELWADESGTDASEPCSTVDDHWFDRWNWVMGEMIWAFSEHTKDWEEAEGQFYSGEADILSVPIDEEGNEVDKETAKYYRLDRGPNDTSQFDKEGWEAYSERKKNGFRLFGKYYESLWD